MSSEVLARPTDPETSHEAAAAVANASQVQRAVLEILASVGPVTDEQIIRRYRTLFGWDATDQSIRSRRAELVRVGLVEFAEIYGLSQTGRRSREWTLTAAGAWVMS